jgi:superfamily II DNA or RNA helicase
MTNHDQLEKSPATQLQDKIIEGVKQSLEKRRDAFISGPTGSGKTRIFTKVAGEKAEQGQNVIVMASRINLVLQAQRNMSKWHGDHIPTSIGYNGQIDQSGNVVYVTVQTANELKDHLKKYDVAIFDEGHHVLEKNKDFVETMEALIKKNPDILFVPASATPPEGYEGMHPRIKNADKHIITFEEALEAKLVRLPETITPPMEYKNNARIDDIVKKHRKNETSADFLGGISTALSRARGDDWAEQLVDKYERHLLGQKTLAFFDSIKEANAFVEEAKLRGHSVEAMHSNKSLNENNRIKSDFESGKVKILASVDMISEGYDIECKSILLDKKTTSLTEYKQIIGRESRGYGSDSTERGILLDTGASTIIHGNISAIAQIHTAKSGLERKSIPKERFLPDVEANHWKPWVEVKFPGQTTRVWATSIGGSIIYAAKTGNGYATLASTKDKKGTTVNLLEIDGEKKGRPSTEAFSHWVADAIQRSGKNLASLVGRQIEGKSELERIIEKDWARNAESVHDSIKLLSSMGTVINKALMAQRQNTL